MPKAWGLVNFVDQVGADEELRLAVGKRGGRRAIPRLFRRDCDS